MRKQKKENMGYLFPIAESSESNFHYGNHDSNYNIGILLLIKFCSGICSEHVEILR